MVHPIAEANDHSPFGDLSDADFYIRHRVSHSSSFFVNADGLKIFTQSWLPLPPTKIIGVVAVIHGFAVESSWLVQLTAVHIAKHGFATCALDLQGHGFSKGLTAHIPDINPVIDDCIAVFDEFRALYSYSLPSFLYGESLGGAIAILINLRQKASRAWSGIVLSGPMCAVSAKFKPPWPLEHFLCCVAALVPTWRVIPTRGRLAEISFKEEWKRRLAIASPRYIKAQPRASTALELLRICREVKARFEEIEAPLLIAQGGDDVVCDPACVEELYRRAVSKDKTLRVYPGMWHQLVGEPPENVELVFSQILEWLRVRAERATNNYSAVTDNACGPISETS